MACKLQMCKIANCTLPQDPLFENHKFYNESHEKVRHLSAELLIWYVIYRYRHHLPKSVNYGDSHNHIHHWARLLCHILDVMGYRTLDDLFDQVIQNAWCPVDRNENDPSANEQETIDAFAEYIGENRPRNYRETNPTSVAMLVNWRVLR